MEQLQILSLEIQRMPKNPSYEFAHVEEYPYRSVCTISTHDMSTLRGWWQEDAALTDRFFHTVLRHSEPTPAEAPGSVCEEVVRRHLESPSMLCILAFQDWLGIDEQLRHPNAAAERINVPANPRHYWRYRMHLTLEQLLQQDAFNRRLRTLIDEAARY
jgi:4-alpha-glucanotransferase